MLRKAFFAIVATVWSGSIAIAADMVLKAPVAPADYNWTGFYIGAFAGGIWGETDSFNSGTNANRTPVKIKANGVVGGIQFGYNYQINPWLVAGLETDFQGSALSAATSATNTTAITLTPFPPGGPNLWPLTGNANARQNVDWYGTLRGRVGFATGPWLFYGTGGFGWQSISTNETFNAPIFGTAFVRGANISTTRSGLAAGGGFEVALRDKWTVGAEYLYLSAGTWNPAIANFAATGPSVVESNRGWNNIVRARLNYRFW